MPSVETGSTQLLLYVVAGTKKQDDDDAKHQDDGRILEQSLYEFVYWGREEKLTHIRYVPNQPMAFPNRQNLW